MRPAGAGEVEEPLSGASVDRFDFLGRDDDDDDDDHGRRATDLREILQLLEVALAVRRHRSARARGFASTRARRSAPPPAQRRRLWTSFWSLEAR